MRARYSVSMFLRTLYVFAALVAQCVVTVYWWPTSYKPRIEVEGSGVYRHFLRGFSPDGKTLYAMAYDRPAYNRDDFEIAGLTAWDVTSGQVRYFLRGGYGCMSISRDSALLSLTEKLPNGQSVAKIYDAKIGKERQNLGVMHSFSITAFTEGGDRLVQLTSVEPIPETTRPCAFYYDCNESFSEFGLLHFHPEIRIWDTNSSIRTAVHRLEDTATKVILSSDGLSIVCLLDNGSIAIFDSLTGKERGKLPRKITVEEQSALRISPNGRLLATGAVLWNMTSLTEATKLQVGSPRIADVSFSPDSSKVFLRDYESVHACDSSTGEEVAVFPANVVDYNVWSPRKMPVIVARQITPFGNAFSWCNRDGTKLIVDLVERNERASSHEPLMFYLEIHDIPSQTGGVRVKGLGPFVSPDGTLIAAYGESGIVLWDLPPRTNWAVFAGLSTAIWSAWLAVLGAVYLLRRYAARNK